MQDYNYLFTNCMEITAELSCGKKPIESHLEVEWENNLYSMLVLLESAQGGIKGKVFDEYGGPLDGATVEFQKFMGKRKNVNTSNRGEFWKLLLPGSYSIKAFH